MKISEEIAGKLVRIEVLDGSKSSDLEEILSYFKNVVVESVPKYNGQISKLNQGKLSQNELSNETKKVLEYAEIYRIRTGGYFNAKIGKLTDPSGLIKGYLLDEAEKKLIKLGYKNFMISFGNDIKFAGHRNTKMWRIGISNPVLNTGSAKVIELSNSSISTSGLSFHNPIYNPLTYKIPRGTKSVSVILQSALEAEIYATTCFAMGIEKGINFLNSKNIYYAIYDTNGQEFLSKNFTDLMPLHI